MEILVYNGSLKFMTASLGQETLSIALTLDAKYVNTAYSVGASSAGTSIALFDISNYVGRRLSITIPKTGNAATASLAFSSSSDSTKVISTGLSCTGTTEQAIYSLLLEKGYKYLFVSYNTTGGVPTVVVDAGKEQNIRALSEISDARKEGYYLNESGGLVTSTVRAVCYYEIGDATLADVEFPVSTSSASCAVGFTDSLSATSGISLPEPKIMGLYPVTKQNIQVDLSVIDKRYLVLCYSKEGGVPSVVV